MQAPPEKHAFVAALNPPGGKLNDAILIAVWAGAAVGIVVELIWVDAPKWVTALVYVGVGWIGVKTLRPPLPVMARVLPPAMNVVCAPLVCPYCKEAMVPPKLRSTTLLMLETVVPPVSKNFTSSPLAGALPVLPAVALVQLAPVDQLFSPAPGLSPQRRSTARN